MLLEESGTLQAVDSLDRIYLIPDFFFSLCPKFELQWIEQFDNPTFSFGYYLNVIFTLKTTGSINVAQKTLESLTNSYQKITFV